jgi:hypothetical protein
MAIEESHSKFPHIYGVVRIDFPFDENNPSNKIALVKVARSKTVAEAEVTRLNKVNAGKSCAYICCMSRLID